MMVLLRIFFTTWWGYIFVSFLNSSLQNTLDHDVSLIKEMALLVLLGIPTSIVWTPWLADRLCGPLMGVITDSTYEDPVDTVGKLLFWADVNGHHKTAVLMALLKRLEGKDSRVYRIGLRNSREGSILQKYFAIGLFTCSNAQYCVEALDVLKRHGLPANLLHHAPEVRDILRHTRKRKLIDHAPLPVPENEAPLQLARNPQIKLFKKAGERPAKNLVSRNKTKSGTQKIPYVASRYLRHS
jgi:hypothetical protein